MEKVVDARYAEYRSHDYIKTSYDALVELITNADDAYTNANIEQGRIVIEHFGKYGRQKDPAKIRVVDNATGMTSHWMKRISKPGAYTNLGGRGFFGAGLTDCQAIADIIVESIKDGVYVRGEMSDQLDESIVIAEEKDASAHLRKNLGIPNNGVSVTLILKDSVKLPRFTTVRQDLPYLYPLRKILEKDSGRIVHLVNGKTGKTERIIYQPPASEEVVSELYKVDGHDVRLRIFRSTSKLDDTPPYSGDKIRKSGIATISGRACHDSSFLDAQLNSNPYSYHYYHGELQCDEIETLLRKYEDGRKLRKKAPANNPIPIVASTRNGLREDHPFIKKLCKKPVKIMRELVSKEAEKAENKVANSKTQDLLDKIAKRIGNIFDKACNEDTDKYPGGLALEKKLQRDGIATFPDPVVVAKSKPRAITVYVLKSVVKKDDKIKFSVVEEDGEVTLQSRPRALKEHALEDRYIGHFILRGEKVGDVLGEVKCGNVKCDTTINVVSKVKRKFDNSIEFDNKRKFEYGRQEVKFYVHESLIPNEEKPFKASIEITSDKGACKIKTRTKDQKVRISKGTNYGIGTVDIDGVVGTYARLTVQVGRHKNSHDIEIVSSTKRKSSPYKAEIASEDLGRFQYRWKDDATICINAKHPSIAGLIGKPPSYKGQNTMECRRAIVMIMTDAVAWKVAQNKEYGGPYEFEGKTSDNVTENVKSRFESAKWLVSEELAKLTL